MDYTNEKKLLLSHKKYTFVSFPNFHNTLLVPVSNSKVDRFFLVPRIFNNHLTYSSPSKRCKIHFRPKQYLLSLGKNSLLCLTNLVKMTTCLDTLESDKHEFLNIAIL